MSMFRCKGCDEQKDSDVVEMFEGDLCEDCWMLRKESIEEVADEKRR